MNHTETFIRITLILLGTLALCLFLFTTFARAQGLMTSKVVGYTQIDECPSAAVIARAIQAGEGIGADYTHVLPVREADTPAFSIGVHYTDGSVTHVVKGCVTLAVHYRYE